MTEFAILNPASYTEEDYRRFFSLCDRARREKLLRMRGEEEKRLSLLAEGALRILLGERLSLHPDSLTIQRAAGGKPSLSPDCGLHFNLSHTWGKSGGRVLLALSNSPVGCDIEGARLPSPGLVKKVCTAAEAAYLGTGEAAPLRFAEIWTAKEAYVKYTGVGIACDLREVEVCRETAGTVSIAACVHRVPLRHFLREGFACALAGGDGALREVFL